MLLEFVSLVKTVMNMLVAILWRLHILQYYIITYYVSGHPVKATPIGLFWHVGRGVVQLL